MKDRVVFITGAASGIGRQIAETCGASGAHVVISDIRAEQAESAAASLREQGFSAIGLHCDVLEESHIQHALQAVLQRWGRLDVLINNAGMQHVAAIEDFPVELFDKMVRMMLTAPFIAIKQVLPIMKRQGYGRILNMASINGVIGFAGKAAYNSSKHGLIGLTKVAALECAPYGITVNALCPGYVDTPLVRNQFEDLARARGVDIEKVLEEVLYPLIPQRRLLSVQEVADYAFFLVSEKAAGITGQAALIDGGYTAQ
jgi:3-hydroxybutyrate dehydrogenase